MPLIVEALDYPTIAVREGLTTTPKSLPPWLFYDETGSRLFEAITDLPEYYLTRTERAILAAHAGEILQATGPVSILELGAGTATKTGLILGAAAKVQGTVLYQPIDVSPTALDEAQRHIQAHIPGVTVQSQVANYITDSIFVQREPERSVLALYIGSSIGNFSPSEASSILTNLRRQLRGGDHLLLGTDLAPNPRKPVSRLLAAYDDAQNVTAQFNLNMLTRLNRELGTNFRLQCFRHEARWNTAESRIEMHLVSLTDQTVTLPGTSGAPALHFQFSPGETIHTENSYKFSDVAIQALLQESGFEVTQSFLDPDRMFAVTLAHTVGQ